MSKKRVDQHDFAKEREAAGFASSEALVADQELRLAIAERDEKQKAQHGGPRPGSGRPRKVVASTDDNTTSVRILNTLAAMARLVASERKISVSDYLNGILLNPLLDDLDAMKSDLTEEISPKTKPK